MESLSQKKLLVISSDANDIAFVKAAKDMGVYVVCCDKYSDWSISPAKLLADDAWNMDYTDTQAVARKCREEEIDGVIAGYSEERVMAACKISEAIGSPFYATEEQIGLTRNKRLFKKLCSQYGIMTPYEYCYSLPMTPREKAAIKYPVIVKPSDSGGRKGISIIEDESQLDMAVEAAAGLSRTGEVIVEDYLKGTELSAVYTFVDGHISLSCLNDKYISEEQGGTSRLCDVAITPSQYYDLYLETVDKGIKNLLRGIGARNGIANIQFIAACDGIKAFEMGYRVNGNDDFKVIRKYNGIDFMKMLISYSLTGSMGDSLKKDNPVFRQYTCTLCMYLHGGTVGKVEYAPLIGKEGIDDICLLKHVGSVVDENGTNGQKAMLVKVSAGTIPEIIDMIHFIQSNTVIEDTERRNMLLRPFDPNRLIKEEKNRAGGSITDNEG